MNASTPAVKPYRNVGHMFRRAMVVRFGGLGDILLSTPTVRALSEAMPGIHIDYVVGAGLSTTLADLPYVQHVYEYDKGAANSSANLHTLMRSIGANGYDLFLNLQPNFRTTLLGMASNAPKKITFKKDRKVDPQTGRVKHAIDDFFKHLGEIGITGPIDRRMDFIVDLDAKSWINEYLVSHELAGTDQLVVINPNATRSLNRWPVDRLAAVCDHFSKVHSLKVAIIGDTDDLDRFKSLERLLKYPERIINTTGRLSIRRLGALLERAHVFLTCDTGPMHIAAALDTPLVCLSGAADPNRTGPLSPQSSVIIDRSLPCIACQRRSCLYGDDVRCMSAITVAQVIREIERVLSVTRAPIALAG